MTPARVGLRSERGPVLAAVMLATGLVALDSTIIATAVPSVVRDLGGFAQFPWLFSIYVLTQAVTTPLYGKLADMFGRKPVMYFGIAAFLVGSVLCGAAWSMLSLIIFRALQGVGAGAVQPISMTIIGDLYTVKERATVQGYVETGVRHRERLGRDSLFARVAGSLDHRGRPAGRPAQPHRGGHGDARKGAAGDDVRPGGACGSIPQGNG